MTDRAAGAANTIDLSEQIKMPGLIQRAKDMYTLVATGKVPEWFGPGKPLLPVAPPQIAGRQFDYGPTVNTVAQPKTTEGVTFGQLQQLADCYDLVRLMIETRKDQLCKLEWSITPRKGKNVDQRCEDTQAFFMCPDKEHTWATWLRMILEDLLVFDAPCIYPRIARDGSLYSLEPVSGPTIKRLIDDFGRTPVPPLPAYQQFLKGLPATDYTREQLVYAPRNPRNNRLYGFSPVEQIVVTINIALRKQAYQLEYYTNGSTPDLILAVPEGWTPAQVAEFEKYWNSTLEGNTAARRGTKFVYNGMDAINTKESVLTDKYDEWLARVVCYCFGMSPQPFVAQVNRATAQSAAEQSKEEGVGPYMDWVRNLIDMLLARFFGAPDLQFKWLEEDETSPEIKAKIQDGKLRTGIICLNEAREQDGMEPIKGGEIHLIYSGTGATPLDLILEPPPPPPALAMPGQGADDVGGGSDPPKVDAKADAKTEEVEKLAKGGAFKSRLSLELAIALGNLPPIIAAQIGAIAGLEKGKKKNVQKVIDALDLSVLANAIQGIESILSDQATSAALKALLQVGIPAGDKTFGIVPKIAEKYAKSRAAELIGADGDGGILGASTRLLIRTTVATALEEGWSVATLSEALSSDYAFSPERADTIADTELRTAINQGELQSWKGSGLVVSKEWLLSNDEGVCDICEGNASQGAIPLDSDFESGDDAPPGHPNCRCSMAPVTTNADDGE